MKKTVGLVALLICLSSEASAQSNPNLTNGQVPTAAQWNSYFSAKQDLLGFTPLNVAGGVMTGRLVTAPPGATLAGFNLTPGTASGSPANGDLWTTSLGLYVQINGSTVGPLISTATPCSLCALINSANNFSVAQVININGGSPAAALTGTALRAINANSTATRLEVDAYGAAGYYSAVGYGGTLASPTALGSGVEIGGFNAWGYNGTSVVGPAGAFRIFTNVAWGAANPTYADVAVTPTGGTAEIEAVKWVAASTSSVNQQIGTPGSIAGSLTFANTTSGTATLQPVSGALGSTVMSIPVGTDTLVALTLTQTLTNKTLTNPVLSTTAPTANGTLGFNTGSALNWGDGTTNHTAVSLDQTQTLTGKTLGSPTITGTIALSGTVDLTGLGSGTCANSIAVTAGGALVTAACPGASSSIQQGATQITSASGSNQILTTGTVSTGTGVLTNTPPTIDSSGNLASVNSIAGTVIATKAQQQAASSSTNVVTPSQQQSHPSAAKAWVNFTTAATPVLNQNYNVSGVAKNSTGNYTVSFMTAFAAATYVCHINVLSSSAINSNVVSEANGSVVVQTYNSSGTVTDGTDVLVVCFGGQ